ncbi:lipopolysaccharide biosynthesis protein [Leptothrix ochracea]|uniref:lipopolysaccharide biosynthesis protein n=1 Tax=Leptothrix ochracea TaxID=735331 RepID=UPI0034E1AFB1
MTSSFGAKSLLRSALLMTGSTYLAYAAGLIINTLIARHLGPADYGRYAYMVWLSGVLVLLMNNGLNISAIRFISESLGRNDQGSAAKLHGWFRRRQVSNTLLVAVLFLLVLPFVQPSGWENDLVFFGALALTASIAKAWYLFSVSTAKGYGLFGIEAMSMTWMSVTNLIAVVTMFLIGSDLNIYLLLFVGISVAHPMIARSQLKRAGIQHNNQRPDADLLSRVKPHLLWTILSTLVWAFSNKAIETFLLNALVGAEAVGFFTIAAALTRGGVEMLSIGLTTVLMPALANAWGSDGITRVARMTADAVRYFHFLGTLLAGLGFFWAGPAIELMYGERFAPAAFLLQVMVIVKGLTLSHSALGAVLSITDNQRIRVFEAVVSVSLSAFFALWLVPSYGLSGAITAHAVSTLLVYVFVVIAVRRLLGMHLPIMAMVGMNLAGVLAMLVSLMAGYMTGLGTLRSSVVEGFVFLVLYPLLTLVLRVWSAKDLSLIDKGADRFPKLRGVSTRLMRFASKR